MRTNGPRTTGVRPEALAAIAATGLTTSLALATGVFTVAVGQVPAGFAAFTELVGLVVGVVTAAVGSLIVTRRPGNRIGRLLCVAGLLYGLLMAGWVYATHAVSTWERSADPSAFTPLAVTSAWTSAWLWVPTVLCLFVLVPLLYPDGLLVAPRWRWVGRAAAAAGATLVVAEAVRPGPLRFDERLLPVDNEIGITWLEPFIDVVAAGTGAALLTLIVLAFASLVVRYRRSGTIVRLQIRWLAASLGLALFAATLSAFVPWLAWLNESFNVVFVTVPIAIAVAILRYGLYEIDRIISRTVGWALLSAVLVGLYAGGVVTLGTVARALTGGARPELVVALSTLLAAAAFGPARRRIQAVVDRRFNRARYDAARLVSSFSNVVRDEVELETVTSALRAVASASVQPASVGVWLAGRSDGAGVAAPRNGPGTPRA